MQLQLKLKYIIRYFILILSLCLFLPYFSPSHGISNSEVIEGYATVIDGDTIIINKHKIRLAHIDAAETKQTCIDKGTTKTVKCGELSKQALAQLIDGKSIICEKKAIDLYKRILAECYMEDINVNKYMIETGNAILYKKDRIYLKEQEQAKEEEIGIWKTCFQYPWIWRKENRIKRGSNYEKTH